MTDTRPGPSSEVDQAPEQQVVYVVPQSMFPKGRNEEIGLLDLWRIVWAGKWTILALTAVAVGIAIYQALAATEWYQAETLLVPAEERSTPALGGQLGGLAALAGVSVGGEGRGEALAVLKSRDFARDFITEFDLLPVLFEERWDSGQERWIADDPNQHPDIRDGVRFFHERIMSVREDRLTGQVTVVIEWTDPRLAAEWANLLVDRLNRRMRDRALAEAETNVAYLQEEMTTTNIVTLQQSVGRLLESELQKLMLARGNAEFAFRVVDRADVPKQRVRPRRSLMVLVAATLGGMVAVLVVFIAHAVRVSRRPSSQST